MTEQELTPWFVNGEKPARDGVYSVRSREWRGFSYWSADFGWGGGARTPILAFHDRHSGAEKHFYHEIGRGWRGLAQDPEAKP